ncbi:MAG: hypothetical protein LBP34_00070 [Flavobacteriaceae bacterium]|jgi:hypothetical protein|nr:hypothetical protein [Flavobacteriaceae bacterium]
MIETQLWVSLMISCLSLFFGLLHRTVDYNRIFILFFSTLAAYNFVYFRTSWNKNFFRKNPFIFFSVGILGLTVLLVKENNPILFLDLMFLSIFVLMYNSGSVIIQFRNVALLKIFVISFVWTYSIVWIGNVAPVSTFGFLSIFLFIMGITIPFDICDMSRDSIQTIPKLVGVTKSKYFSCFCLLGSMGLFFLAFPEEIKFSIPWGLTCGASMIMTVFMKPENSYFYTRFWIEACSSFPLVFSLIQKIEIL